MPVLRENFIKTINIMTIFLSERNAILPIMLLVVNRTTKQTKKRNMILVLNLIHETRWHLKHKEDQFMLMSQDTSEDSVLFFFARNSILSYNTYICHAIIEDGLISWIHSKHKGSKLSQRPSIIYIFTPKGSLYWTQKQHFCKCLTEETI